MIGTYTEQFRTLLRETRRYLLLQKRFVALDVADKLIAILSTIAIAVVCFVLGVMVLFFLTFALAYWIGQMAGSLALGFLAIALLHLILVFIFYHNRTRWIIMPLARMMSALFAGQDTAIEEEMDEEESTHEQPAFRN